MCFGTLAKKAKEKIHFEHGITADAPRNFEDAKELYLENINKL